MAAPHMFLTYSIKDAKGKVSIAKINFPDTSDIADIVGFAEDAATAINNIIKGKIIDAGIGIAVDISGATIRSSPDSNSDVEEGARFSFRSAIGALTNLRLPTFDEAKMVSGTQVVNTADTAVDAFVDLMVIGNGVGAGFGHPSDDHGEDVVSLESARESFTSTRN